MLPRRMSDLVCSSQEAAPGPATHRAVARFEVLPLGRSEEEAGELPEPAWLTVTCSPKLGPDRTVEVATRLHALGHDVTPHIAARMVRDRDHLDRLLARMAACEVHDLFVIGGDSPEPLGEYSSAGELLADIVGQPQRPPRIGIAAYPEGHPKIDHRALAAALQENSRVAGYVTTQLVFEPEVLLKWLRAARAGGLALPVRFGMPGVVDRRRLLEISMRIGVGPSLSFVRKQRGIRKLLTRSSSSADHLYDVLAPTLHDRELNVEGFHFYTFNQLVATWRWAHDRRHRAVLAAESS
jgi:methylenetetrahydrofolate reductase (NADPH)